MHITWEIRHHYQTLLSQNMNYAIQCDDTTHDNQRAMNDVPQTPQYLFSFLHSANIILLIPRCTMYPLNILFLEHFAPSHLKTYTSVGAASDWWPVNSAQPLPFSGYWGNPRKARFSLKLNILLYGCYGLHWQRTEVLQENIHKREARYKIHV